MRRVEGQMPFVSKRAENAYPEYQRHDSRDENRRVDRFFLSERDSRDNAYRSEHQIKQQRRGESFEKQRQRKEKTDEDQRRQRIFVDRDRRREEDRSRRHKYQQKP